MATEWFYFQDDQRLGPFTPHQLKELAVQGTLLPESMIWKEGLEKPVPARKLKGLFGGTAGEPVQSNPATPPSGEAVSSTEPKPNGIEIFLKKHRNEVWFLALTLVCCFPAGLYFVWTHPTYSKRKKWIITGSVTAFFLLVSLGDKSQPTNRRNSEPSERVSNNRDPEPPHAKNKHVDSVSKGILSGSFNVELSPQVAGEIKLTELKMDGNRLYFKLKWISANGRGSRESWSFSAYDKSDVKLDSGLVIYPGSLREGDTVKCYIHILNDNISEMKKVVIHE